jgi:hypothetical protein
LEFPLLDSAEVDWLGRPFQEEVLQALLSVDDDKAPALMFGSLLCNIYITIVTKSTSYVYYVLVIL